MFFIGIFGIDSKEKEIKTFSNIVCPDCGRLTSAVFYTTYTYFHIFFIPTFRWNRKYFIKLRCCGAVYEVPEEYAQQLRETATIDFSRLKKVSSGFGAFGGFEDTYARCKNCGRTFDNSYSYCPHCGTKQ